eukprot:1618073-Lingulodinium_polyedra.AAC.1
MRSGSRGLHLQARQVLPRGQRVLRAGGPRRAAGGGRTLAAGDGAAAAPQAPKARAARGGGPSRVPVPQGQVPRPGRGPGPHVRPRPRARARDRRGSGRPAGASSRAGSAGIAAGRAPLGLPDLDAVGPVIHCPGAARPGAPAAAAPNAPRAVPVRQAARDRGHGGQVRRIPVLQGGEHGEVAAA